MRQTCTFSRFDSAGRFVDFDGRTRWRRHPLGIDHKLTYSHGGIRKRGGQTALTGIMVGLHEQF